MDNEQAVSAKQQLLELLRSANSLVITMGANPGVDEIAASLGLRMLLEKLDKSVEVVTSGTIPNTVKFLPVDSIHDKVQGQRDFIVTIDQSRAEADHLKYDIIEGKIKLFVTPYSGKFTEADVSYSYGDYHCDAIVGLGVQSPGQIDSAIASDQQLMKNAQVLLINAGQASSDQSALSWSDATSSSVCEMIMSISEALGSGLLDENITTALFTGIVDKTNHFTNSATTPKVMTMAAQLLAAGARQADVVKNLSENQNRSQNQDQSSGSNGSGQSRQKVKDEDSGKNDTNEKPQESTKKQAQPNELQVRPHKEQNQDKPSQDGKPKHDQSQPKPPQRPDSNRDQTSAPGPTSSDGGQTPSSAPSGQSTDKVESMQIPSLPPQPPQTPNAQKPADVPPGVPPPPSAPQGSGSASPYSTPLNPNQHQHDKVLQPPAKPQPPQLSGSPTEFQPQPRPDQPVPPPSPPPSPPPTFTPPSQPPPTPSSQSAGAQQGSSAAIDLEAARRAVEEAAKNSPPPPEPGQQ